MRLIYVLTNLNSFRELASQFGERFAPLELSSLMRDISFPRPFHTIIPSKDDRQMYLEAISFLLRHNIVVHLFMYLLLCVPESVLEKVGPSPGHKKPFIIPNPSEPTDFERECINQLQESRHNPIVRDLFQRCIFLSSANTILCRLVPYMNGNNHLDEIIFQENVSRKDLRLLMSSFREEILTTLHG